MGFYNFPWNWLLSLLLWESPQISISLRIVLYCLGSDLKCIVFDFHCSEAYEQSWWILANLFYRWGNYSSKRLFCPRSTAKLYSKIAVPKFSILYCPPLTSLGLILSSICSPNSQCCFYLWVLILWRWFIGCFGCFWILPLI